VAQSAPPGIQVNLVIAKAANEVGMDSLHDISFLAEHSNVVAVSAHDIVIDD
jgi:hypothetical protein